MSTFVRFYNGKENILSDFIKFLRAIVQIHDIAVTKWAARLENKFFISGAPRPSLCTDVSLFVASLPLV